MLVLDTSVLAALMQSEPDPTLVRWLDAQPRTSVWTTTLTVAELEAHLAQVAERERRQRLQAAFDAVLADDLSGRVLAFDRAAATAAAGLSARERRAGRRLQTRDALIAGIVLARKATLATPDAERFERLGIRTLDPWHAAANP
jgi:toxin FitB